MDIQTMYLVLGLGYLVFGLMLLLFQWREEPAHRIPFYAGAKIAQGIGTLLFFGRGVLPDIFTITLANCFLLVGCAYECWAILRITGCPVRRALHLSTAIVVTLICIAYSATMTSHQRIVVASMLHTVFFALPAWALLTSSKQASWLTTYLGGSFALLAVVFIARTIWALFAGANDFIFTASTIHQLVFALLYYMALTSGFGILLLAKAQADDELRSSEARFRSYFDLPLAGIAITSLEKGWLEVNAGLCAMLGYSAQELAGLTWADLTHADDLAADEAQFRRVLACEIDAYTLEKRYIRKNGDIFWASMSAGCVRGPDGAVAYFVALLQDINARKQAEASLQQAEERFRSLIEQAPVAISLSRNGVGLYANPEFLLMFGLASAEEAVGRDIAEYFAPPYRAASKERTRRRALGLPTPAEIEGVALRPDGSEFPVAVAISSAELADGPVALAFVTDITARKQAEAAQREAEARFRSMFEHHDALMLLIEPQSGAIIDANPAAARFYGYALDELRQMQIEQVNCLPPEQVAADRARAVAGERNSFVFPHRLASGAIRDVEVHSTPVSVGGQTLLFSIIHDITERARAETALIESERRFRAVLEQVQLVCATLDLDANITFINDNLLDLTGWQRAEVMGRNWFDVFIPPQAAVRQDLFATVDAGAVPMHYENEILTRAGVRRLIAWNNILLRDANGAVTGITGIGVDITESRQAEAALTQARDAAEAANRAKSTFLANMSHELRTPLNAILGFSELMARDPRLTADQQENLAIINRSGDHLLGLINGVLDMAKIESGRIALQEQDFDLHTMLADVIELFRARAEAKGILLTLTQWPETPHYIHADEGKLRQVLANMLGNAVKFTQKGIIEVTVRSCGAVADMTTHRLCFTVHDSGSGIAPADLTTIFDAFVQLQGDLQTQEGTGLGLAISQHLVRLMGGELRATSTGVAGEGSCFAFELTVQRAATAARGAASPRSRHAVGLAPGQPRFRLLVVEDHPESRQLLARLLMELGFDVRTADNGQTAITAWEAWRPHLIWMDMRMPVLDGHAATRHIKAAAHGDAPIIIALTASVFESERVTVLAEGCDDFVRKPFREEEIVAQLEKHLGVHMLHAEPLPSPPPAPLLPHVVPKRLSVAWIAQVQAAATIADASALDRLITQIHAEHPALANVLHTRLGDFDYTGITELLTRSQEA